MRLRWPFSPARRGKAIVESEAKNGRRGCLFAAAPGGRAFRMTPWAKKAVSVQLDGLSPLPVEEKSVSGLPGSARDGSSPCLWRKRLLQVSPRSPEAPRGPGSPPGRPPEERLGGALNPHRKQLENIMFWSF